MLNGFKKVTRADGTIEVLVETGLEAFSEEYNPGLLRVPLTDYNELPLMGGNAAICCSPAHGRDPGATYHSDINLKDFVEPNDVDRFKFKVVSIVLEPVK